MYHYHKLNGHIQLVTNKLKNKTCGFKIQLINFPHQSKIRVVYQSLVESIMNYKIAIWKELILKQK